MFESVIIKIYLRLTTPIKQQQQILQSVVNEITEEGRAARAHCYTRSIILTYLEAGGRAAAASAYKRNDQQVNIPSVFNHTGVSGRLISY